MSFITRSVMTTSKGDSSISLAPSRPEVATRQWQPIRSKTLGHGLGVRLVVIDNQHFGGRIESPAGRLAAVLLINVDDSGLEGGERRGDACAYLCGGARFLLAAAEVPIDG